MVVTLVKVSLTFFKRNPGGKGGWAVVNNAG